MWETLSGYITGTFLVALFHGVAMGLTLYVVGVPLVAPLAVLVFLGSFIPIVGVVVFGGLAVLVSLVANGATAGIIVLIALLVENQIESHVLQPFVVGRHVRLHPMAIALTLGAGAIVAGLPGAIFGVPLVASVNAAMRRDPSTSAPREHGGSCAGAACRPGADGRATDPRVDQSSMSWRLSTLPVALRGRSARNSSERGTL